MLCAYIANNSVCSVPAEFFHWGGVVHGWSSFKCVVALGAYIS